MIFEEEDYFEEPDFLLEVQKMEEKELISQKRRAAIQLRDGLAEQRQLINQKRIVAIQLKKEKLISAEAIRVAERNSRGKKRCEARVAYFVNIEKSKKKRKGEEAEMVRLSEDMEDVISTMNEILDEIDMLEVVESVSIMDAEEKDDVTRSGGRMLEVGDGNKPKKSKGNKKRNEKIEVTRTRMSVRMKRNK